MKDPTERLLHDLEHIRSPWYWIHNYVAVGCMVVVFALIVAAAYLVLIGG